MTRDEEREMFRTMAAADPRTSNRMRDDLVKRNMGLIGMVAKKHATPHTQRHDDLLAAGMLGLAHAIKNFNPELGYRFSTFSMAYIHRFIQMELNEIYDSVGVGVSNRQQRWRAVRTLRGVKNAEDVKRVLAQERMSPARTHRLLMALGAGAVRLNATIRPATYGPATDVEVGDRLPASDAPADEQLERARYVEALRAKVASVRKDLSEREIDILEYKLLAEPGTEATLKTIGDFWGVSRERARQVEEKLKAKLALRLADFAYVPTKSRAEKTTPDDCAQYLADRFADTRPWVVKPKSFKKTVRHARRLRAEIVQKVITEAGITIATKESCAKIIELATPPCNEAKVAPPTVGYLTRLFKKTG